MKILNIYSRETVLRTVYLGFFISIIGLAAWVSYQAIGINYSLLRNSNFQAPQLAHETQKEQASKDAAHFLGKLPIHFEKNVGQYDPSIKYISRVKDYQLFLTSQEAILASKNNTVLKMQFAPSVSSSQPSAQEELSGKTNYFLSQDAKQWKTNVSHFGKVVYESVYLGIDLVFYGNQNQLEYDFVVSPGADPKSIQLKFSGTKSIQINSEGDLIIETDYGKIQQHRPVIYQEAKGLKIPIQGGYVIQGQGEVSFNISNYDNTLPLIIDPVLAFSTYLGGKDSESASDIAVDKAGNIYIVGGTSSSDFPGMNDNVFQPNKVEEEFTWCISKWSKKIVPCSSSDVFITKINPSGDQILFTTFLGGSGDEGAESLVLDEEGNILIVGSTDSMDFPITVGSAIQPVIGGESDAFVAKINSDGSALLYSTYVGGSQSDYGDDLSIGDSDNIYVVGDTYSDDLPTTVNAIQPNFNGNFWTTYESKILFFSDIFIAKINLNSNYLSYLTYLGGDGDDFASGIALDTQKNIYVAGQTFSTDFSGTETSLIQSKLAGKADGFVTKISADGTSILYSTYLGGKPTVEEWGDWGEGVNSIAVDLEGNAYVTGFTRTFEKFPGTQGSLIQSKSVDDGSGNSMFDWSGDGFVTEINADGTEIVYSTYLSGGHQDEGRGIAVDSAGYAYVIGTVMEDIEIPLIDKSPIQSESSYSSMSKEIKSTKAGSDFLLTWAYDAFILRILPKGKGVDFATYLGGTDYDGGSAIAMDATGKNIYVAGSTVSNDFPKAKKNKIQNALSGRFSDGFIAKIDLTPFNFGPTDLEDGQVGVFYDQSLVGYGKAPYKFKLMTPRKLVPGLKLSSNGHITGVPTKAGTFKFTIDAKDALGNQARRTYQVIVSPECPAINLFPSELPQGTVGEPYLITVAPGSYKNIQIEVEGGKAPYYYEIVDGELPPGLEMYDENGEINGTPEESGEFSFVVKVTDDNGCEGVGSFSINIVSIDETQAES